MFTIKMSIWKDWLLQVALSAVLGWIFLGPIWRLTFENAGRPLSVVGVLLLVLLSLIPFWILQFIALRCSSLERRRSRWILFLTSYVAGLSMVFLIALHLTKRFRILKIPHWIQVGASFLLVEVIFFGLIHVYAVLVAELVNKLV